MTYLFDIDGVINKADYFSIQYEKDFGIDKSVFDTFFINEFEKCANGTVDIKTVLPKYFKEWKWKKAKMNFSWNGVLSISF